MQQSKHIKKGGVWTASKNIQQFQLQKSLINQKGIGEMNPLIALVHNTDVNTQAHNWYTPPQQCHETLAQFAI